MGSVNLQLGKSPDLLLPHKLVLPNSRLNLCYLLFYGKSWLYDQVDSKSVRASDPKIFIFQSFIVRKLFGVPKIYAYHPIQLILEFTNISILWHKLPRI